MCWVSVKKPFFIEDLSVFMFLPLPAQLPVYHLLYLLAAWLVVALKLIPGGTHDER